LCNEFDQLDFSTLQTSLYGKIVKVDCVESELRIFENYLRSGQNPTFPMKCGLCIIDGTLYIKSLPLYPHEGGVVAICEEMNRLNERLGCKVLKLVGQPDHRVQNGIIQEDVGIKRKGRRCENLVCEVGYSQSTTELINKCRLHLTCPNVHYVVGFDILPFHDSNLQNKQVRILVHIFQRNINDNRAPISITSFGNDPDPTFHGPNGVFHHLVHTHYPQHANVIQFRGIGFDPNAPPCNVAYNPATPGLNNYYLLWFDPALLLSNNDNIQDNGAIPVDRIPHLADLTFFDLYEIQCEIRLGFFEDAIFGGDLDDDLQGR
jgi:hypothetical protein